MKKLRRNTNAKALAIFLVAFFVPLSAAMTFGAGMLRSYDAYEADTLAESRILDELYDFLAIFGYQMSEEELQFQNGTHPLFEREDEEASAA